LFSSKSKSTFKMSLLSRLTTSIRLLAHYFGGLENNDSPSDSTMDTVEAMENELGRFLNLLPSLDTDEPNEAKTLIRALDSWLDELKVYLPYPVTTAVVEKMLELSDFHLDELSEDDSLSTTSIRTKYADYFISDEDQMDAMYAEEGNEEEEDDENVIRLEAPESWDKDQQDAAERLQMIENFREWKEDKVEEYVKGLSEAIKDYLGESVLELGSGSSTSRAAALAQLHPSTTFYPAFVPSDCATLPNLPSSSPTNLIAPLPIDPTTATYFHHALIQPPRRLTSWPKEFSCLLVSCVDSLDKQGYLLECVAKGAKKLVREEGKLVIWTGLDQASLEEWKAGPKPKEVVKSKLPLVVNPGDEEAIRLAAEMGRMALTPDQLNDRTLGVGAGDLSESEQTEELPLKLADLVADQIVPLAWRNFFRHVESVLIEDVGTDPRVAGLLVLVFERDAVDSDDDVDLTVF